MSKGGKLRRKRWISAAAVIAAIAMLGSAWVIYVSDYYHADTTAIAAVAPITAISTEAADDYIVYTPADPVCGLIFYPGGKVEHTAYAPLMQACAERGILCVLVKMPMRLAVLDVHAADGITAMYPQIKQWYIGGHSLGGSMAATYLAEHSTEYAGLVLLGAYSTADLSDAPLAALSIYGSKDTVLNAEKYAANHTNLPIDTTELVINGGCHAYFGMYGTQNGDGTPTITNAEQIRITADAIEDFVKR